MNNLEEVIDYLNSVNDVNDLRYEDCVVHSYINLEWYKKILNTVLTLDEKPKRIIDIGSNMNQYAFLFNNEGIDYVGIDLWNANRNFKVYENEHAKFIGADYRDIKDYFKDDVIISCLCVGYLVDIKDVVAKHLIINGIEEGKAVSKLIW